MFNWLRELKEIWQAKAECQSCEILKIELSAERREKQRLLDHLLVPPASSIERLEAPEPKSIENRHIPWRVRQQGLEQADREKAQVLAEFKRRDAEIRKGVAITPATSIEDLEANLGIVQEK